jgi:hypothetical protein
VGVWAVMGLRPSVAPNADGEIGGEAPEV